MPKASTDSRPSWTILELVRWTTGYFADNGFDSARSEAEILLAHALGMRRIDLYLNHDKPLGEAERGAFKRLIRRRLGGEPVAYITGRKEFWSLDLAVNPAVLIPRPETECLVEAVLPFLAADTATPKRVLDLGSGSGAIIIALAHEHPRHRFVATDRSMAALATARHNARAHNLSDRIDWFCGDWLSALAPQRARFDLIVSNPPYIRSADIAGLQREIRDHEPRGALDGDADGLACLRRIIRAAPDYLQDDGVLAVELGFDQADAVRAAVTADSRYGACRIVKDYSGLDRVAVMEHHF